MTAEGTVNSIEQKTRVFCSIDVQDSISGRYEHAVRLCWKKIAYQGEHSALSSNNVRTVGTNARDA